MANDSGRSPSNKSMNMSSSNAQGTSGNPGPNRHGSSRSAHHNGNVNKSNQSTPASSSVNLHQHHSQCHHLQKNFSSSASVGNTLV